MIALCLLLLLGLVNAYEVDAADVELYTTDAEEEYSLQDVEYEEEDMNSVEENEEEEEEEEDNNEEEDAMNEVMGDEFLEDDLDAEIDEEMESFDAMEEDDEEEEEEDDEEDDEEEDDEEEETEEDEYSLTDDFDQYFASPYYADPFAQFFNGFNAYRPDAFSYTI